MPLVNWKPSNALIPMVSEPELNWSSFLIKTPIFFYIFAYVILLLSPAASETFKSFFQQAAYVETNTYKC